MSGIRIIAGSRVTRPESTLGQGMMDHAAERCGQIEGDIAKTVLSVLTADTLHPPCHVCRHWMLGSPEPPSPVKSRMISSD